MIWLSVLSFVLACSAAAFSIFSALLARRAKAAALEMAEELAKTESERVALIEALAQLGARVDLTWTDKNTLRVSVAPLAPDEGVVHKVGRLH